MLIALPRQLQFQIRSSRCSIPLCLFFVPPTLPPPLHFQKQDRSKLPRFQEVEILRKRFRGHEPPKLKKYMGNSFFPFIFLGLTNNNFMVAFYYDYQLSKA